MKSPQSLGKAVFQKTYRIVFIGLIDDLPRTKEKFTQHVPKVFKVTGKQIDKLIANSPVIIKKNLSKAKADSIAKKLEQIGGRVSVQSDHLVESQDRRTVPREKSAARFAVYINKIESEDAKHRMAKYLDGVLDLNYIEIRNGVLRDIPAILPVEFDHEEAQNIRGRLEGFGSRVSIGEIREDGSTSVKGQSRSSKRDIAIFGGILLILLAALMFLLKSFNHEDGRIETVNVPIAEEPLEPGDGRIENRVHLPLTRHAIEALQEVEARYGDDITYGEYVEILRDTKSTVNSYLNSQEAENRVQIANSILNILIHYENAAEIWRYKTRYNKNHVESVRDDIQIYVTRYPDLKKPVSEGGATEEIDGGREVLRIDAVVSIVMDQAAEELRRVSKRVDSS